MKKCFFLLLWIFTFQSALADGPIYLPVLVKGESMAIDPILRITNGTDVIDLLGNESGWELEDPYWNPQIAQYKSGGSYVNSGLAEGQRLVHKEYDNVIETIPLSAHGIDQNRSIQTVRRLLQMAKQASDYWTKSYEYDDVWIEARPACNDCLTGYARVIKMSIPEVTNPYGQPFFSSFNDAVMNGITLTIEREPLWRGLPPGEILGPMYNLLKNSDFELWNFGVADSQPDSWSDLETLQITGQNSREATVPNSGQYALKVRVSGSTAAGKAKGVTQIAESTKNNTEYTVVAWVRSDGVSNGVGRILVTYSSQLEVYRASDRHGWTLYTGKFTTGINDVVSINLEILTTAANTDGTIYIDSLMLLEGDFEEAAANGTLPYMTSSHVVNHWDQPGGAVVEAGDLNFVDVWNVPGDEDALVRLNIQNNSNPANPALPVEIYSVVRVGQRRTGNVLNFRNYFDPTGVADATASSDNRVNSGALTTSWVDIVSTLITGGQNVLDNQGRYRVIARLYDEIANPTLKARLRYFLGSSVVSKTLESVDVPIGSNWTAVDITPNAAMIQERKFTTIPAGQIGYALQLSRRINSATNARVDYVLAIPTDGGYLKADINPALTYGNMMVIDNTASQTISATKARAGWRVSFNSGQNWVTSFKPFKGQLYAGIGNDGTGIGRVYRYTGTTWTQVFAGAGATSEPYLPLEVYNGKLYVGGYALAGGAPLWETQDGVSWAKTGVGSTERLITALKSFNGKLFFATFIPPGTGKIYYYDGTSITTSLTLPALDYAVSFEVYNGKLFAGIASTNPTTSILVYDPVSNSWSTSITFPVATVSAVYALKVYNDVLYAGTNYTPRLIYIYDGSTWTYAFDGQLPAGGAIIDAIRTLHDYDGVLYAGGVQLALTAAPIFTSIDGVNWSLAYDARTGYVLATEVVDGVLYIGLQTGGVASDIYTLSDTDVLYEVSDFQGGTFTAPPRRFSDPRRHRWVFSYDREGFINNADDKALIGLGYVPRYLTLRGAN